MPVASTIKKYRKLQAGFETVPGTEVAATRVLRVNNVSWDDFSSWRKYIPDYDIGRMTMDPDVGEITRKGHAGRIKTDLSFEDFPFYLLAGLKGGVDPGPEQTVGQGDFLWPFKNTPIVADPAQDSLTLEQRFSNGTTNFDRTAAFCLASAIELSFDQDADATVLTVEFFGRTPNNNALTGALTLPVPFDIIAALDWNLYLDDTWAGLGTTQISSAMRTAIWRYTTGLTPALYIGDGRLDMADVRLGPRGAELTMTWEMGTALNDELADFEANSKRFVRLEATGAQIGTGLNKRITIDGAYQYSAIGEPGEAEGNDTRQLTLRTVADDDTNDLAVEVVNTLASY